METSDSEAGATTNHITVTCSNILQMSYRRLPLWSSCVSSCYNYDSDTDCIEASIYSLVVLLFMVYLMMLLVAQWNDRMVSDLEKGRRGII
jgi:hypothetical protein